MMLTDNFQTNVPTKISFVLYKYDHIDSIIISTILKECRNTSMNKNEYSYNVNEFVNAIKTSARLRSELSKIDNIENNSSYKPNSLYFLISIIKSLTNLHTITFKISNDRNYSRVFNYENNNYLNFYYKIEEGFIDFTQIYDRDELDYMNKLLIELGLISNEYLNRSSYIYVKCSSFFDAFSTLAVDEEIVEKVEYLIDPKIDEDDPILLIKTDYTQY